MMAKVMVSPAVCDFSDLRPSSRALAINPRPSSSCGYRRPQSASSSTSTAKLDISPRSQVSPQQVLIVSPGRSESSFSSTSSFGGSQIPNWKLSSIEVESLLREKIRANFAEIKQAFQSLDAQKCLSVTKSEFRQVLDAFCFPLTKEQFDQLVKKIGSNRDGTICYGEFMDKFHHRGGTPDALKWLSNLHKYQLNKTPTEDYEEIEKRLKTKISGQLQSILKAMRLFDYNRDGHIQRHELRRVLENFCFKLSDAQFDKLWCKYDMVRNGSTLEYMDFFKRLGVETKRKGFAGKALKASAASDENQRVKLAAVNSRRPHTQSSDNSTEPPTTLRDLEQKLRKKMVDNFGNISRAFVAFDRKGDGFVTLDELKRVLFHFAFPMSDYLFEQLMDRCGIRANHKISYEQFLNKFQEPRAAGNGQTIPIKHYHRVNPIREAEGSLSTEDIWNQLRKKVLDSFTTVKQAFLVFDDNKDGRVTKRDFRRVLESFCFRMNEPQFQELMARIDPHNKGYISYLEFLDAFEPRETTEAHPWLYGDNSLKSVSPPAIVAWSTVEDILRSKITENWKSIAAAYMKVDENRDGSVSKDELKKLLEKYCLPLSDDHFDMLWSRCDTNNDDEIDFDEFLNKLGVDIVAGDLQGTSTRIHDESEARANFMREDQTFRQELAEERALGLTGQMNANDVMEILKDHIAQRSSNFRKTFVKFDGDGDGKISRKEFRQVLESLGLHMTDEQFRLLSARLGFHKGKLSYMDFLDQFQDRRTFGVGERVVYQGQRHNQPVPLDDDMDAVEVEMKLRNKLRESFKDLREAFHKIDFDRNGYVTRAEFRRILDSLMFSISNEEFDKLMRKLGVKRGCRLNYVDFLKQFEHTEKIEEGHPWLYSNHSLKKTRDMAYVTADDADRIIKQKAKQQMDSVAKAFLAFDRDGNGVVTKKEMRKVLYHFQIPMEKEEFNKLWKRYDTDGNGHVDHKEFLAKLGVEMTPGDFHGPSTKITEQSYDAMAKFHQSQKEIHESSTLNQANTTSFLTALEVEQQLKDKFRDGYESFRKAFEAADTNRDGYVSKVDLQKVLFDFYYFLDDVQLGILLDRCGLSGKSRLSYEKFLSAFQDNHQSGYGTLDTPFHGPAPVVFESHENLSPDRAIAKLRTAISSNYDNVRKAFIAFDRNGTGLITKQDLHQIINAFCFWMSPKQFKALLKQTVILEGDLIAYEDFLRSFQKSDAEASRRWLENLHPVTSSNRRGSLKHKRTLSDEEVDKRISEVVVARFYSFAKAFTDNDIHHWGSVSRDTLRMILNEHAFRMNDEQFDHVCSKFNSDPDGAIDYKEFLKRYSSRPGVRRASSATPTKSRERQSPPETPLIMRSAVYSSMKRFSRDSIRPATSASDIERKVKDQVCRSWQQLQKSFRNADPDNTGTVSFEQLKDVLLKHNIIVTPSEILVLCRKHDAEGSGKVVYKDFLRHFVLTLKPRETALSRPKLQPNKKLVSPGVRSDQLVDLMATIRSQVRENWKEMRRAFRALDKAGNGTCELVEFRQLLKRFKIDLDEEEFFHLFSFYDKNMNGIISYNDFLRAHLE